MDDCFSRQSRRLPGGRDGRQPATRRHFGYLYAAQVYSCDMIQLVDNFVQLRRYEKADAAAVFEAVRESVRELKLWFDWAHDDYSIDETKAWLMAQEDWWRSREVYNFAITDPDKLTFLGGCLLNHINHQDSLANLSYWVRGRWTGTGVATAASRLVATYGFEDLALNRIEIVIAKGNEASIRVAEKLGAKREGELRRRIRVRGDVHDAWMYSLIPGDLY
jgi:ribosomal-protein-serine acetyltransferase